MRRGTWDDARRARARRRDGRASAARPPRQAGRRRRRAGARGPARPRPRHVHGLARGRGAARGGRAPVGDVELRRPRPARRRPGFAAAVADGTVEDRELSEWMLVGGLRAAAMGVPFLPTRAGLGSELVEARGLRTVIDPYTGEEYLAVPAIRPDVAFVHAWRADEDGNVQLPWPPDHLADVDLLVARAARTTVVSVEEVVAARGRRGGAGADAALRLRGRPARRGAGRRTPGQRAAALRGRRAWLADHADDPAGALLAG